jgi:hypothetical protein
MAKCSRCGNETELYDGGVPICLACVERAAQQKRDSESNKRPRKPFPLAVGFVDPETH